MERRRGWFSSALGVAEVVGCGVGSEEVSLSVEVVVVGVVVRYEGPRDVR